MSSDYLNIKWQKKRLEILNRDEFTCQECMAGEDHGVTLHVHHLWYAPNRKPWDYPDTALKTLCSECHTEAHYLLSEGQARDLHQMFCQCGLTPQQIECLMITLRTLIHRGDTLHDLDLWDVHLLFAKKFGFPVPQTVVNQDFFEGADDGKAN